MAGPLQFDIGTVARRKSVGFRMQFIRPQQILRPRHGDGVAPACAAFRRKQVVIAAPPIQMWAFGEPDRRSLENKFPLTDQLPFRVRVFLQYDTGETVVAGTVIQQHVHQILAPVLVVE